MHKQDNSIISFLNKNKIYIYIFIFTILIALPKFGYETSDAIHYMNLAEFFRGNIESNVLREPFCYRVIIPFFSSLLPFPLKFNFAILNLAITIIAYFIFVSYLKEFTESEEELYFGIFLLVFSFPTFNYASNLLTDSGGFLIIVLSLFLLIKQKKFLFSIILSFGILIRESVLFLALLLPFLVIFNYKRFNLIEKIKLILLTILPIFCLIISRIIISLFLNLNSKIKINYFPSSHLLVSNLINPIAWITLLLTILPPLIFYIIGAKLRNDLKTIENQNYKEFIVQKAIIANLIFFFYAISIANMSGRFVWSLYPMIIPLILKFFCKTDIFRNNISPIIRKIID